MHLDEVIDRQVWERKPEDLVITVFGDSRLAKLRNADLRIVKLIDPARRTVSILGERFDLDALYEQTNEIARHLQEVEHAVGTAAGLFLSPEEPAELDFDAQSG